MSAIPHKSFPWAFTWSLERLEQEIGERTLRAIGIKMISCQLWDCEQNSTSYVTPALYVAKSIMC